MDLVTAIVLLFVGVSTFLIGMDLMSSNLKKATGKGVKNLFKKIGNNRVLGVGIGAAVTALVQSSSATCVMVIGFLNAGVLSIFQGFSISLGAYLGTTVTGILVSLSSFNISIYLMLFAFVGVVLSFFKKPTIKYIGGIFSGLGILFFGLEALKQAFEYEAIQNACTNLFSTIEFPLLLFLIGVVVTAIGQSSSATTGIVIIMAGSGAIDFDKALYIALGATVGTIITMALASIGGSINSKRTTFLAIITRTTTALIALLFVSIFATPITNFFLTLFSSYELAIAMATVFYNVIALSLILPFEKQLVKLSEKVIKDKSELKKKQLVKHIDDNLLRTPAVARSAAKEEIIEMALLSKINLELGYKMMIDLDLSRFDELKEREESIDYINNALTDFLIKLSPLLEGSEEKKVGSYFHVINDIERIGDHGSNFSDLAQEMKENDLMFSDTAKGEFKEMYEIVMEMYDISIDIFSETKKGKDNLKRLHDLEGQTDDLKIKLDSAHYDRLKQHTCKVELSPYYTSLASELERVADHLTNIGYSIVSPTGDMPGDKKISKRKA
ncbi:MAG: Na/Pi cotransporter family protein [Gammaproteobacteria bacterium]|nr:Na/Pi cotransporter family protein [Gammaproteobacteria bacterium]